MPGLLLYLVPGGGRGSAMGHRLSLMGRAVGQHRVPPNTRRSTNAGLLLAHRVRRWTNIKPALNNIFAGVFACWYIIRSVQLHFFWKTTAPPHVKTRHGS